MGFGWTGGGTGAWIDLLILEAPNYRINGAFVKRSKITLHFKVLNNLHFKTLVGISCFRPQ